MSKEGWYKNPAEKPKAVGPMEGKNEDSVVP